MKKYDKILEKIKQGNNDNSINFNELRHLLILLGFSERIRGDHHFFCKPEISEAINIQPRGKYAKPYQVKQIRSIITKYNLEVKHYG